MGAIVIKSDNNKNLKLLTELAEQLGESVSKLTVSQAEDIQLGMLMKREKTGKAATRESIFKHLAGDRSVTIT
jgi:hypothetical protein